MLNLVSVLFSFFICTLNASKVILSLLIWTEDCTQFLSENRLYGCQIFGRFVFGSDILYPNTNRISDIRTPLMFTYSNDVADLVWHDHWPFWLDSLYSLSMTMSALTDDVSLRHTQWIQCNSERFVVSCTINTRDFAPRLGAGK